MPLHFRPALAGSAIAGVLLCAAGAAAAADPSPALKSLIEAANKEGALNLSWGEGTLGGSQGLRQFEREINAAYGTKLKITFTPGDSMPAMGNKIATLMAAGQPSLSDVYIAYVRTMGVLHAKNMFHSADWKALGVPEGSIEADGTMIKIVSATPAILYNTRAAPHKPERLTDFLKPEWKGKIASTPYAANFDMLASNEMWGPEKALDFSRKLSDQLAGLIRCNEVERIASGEFAAFLITCTGNDADDIIKKGAPLAQVVPRDFAVVGYFYLSVPKNAVHPNAAKLFTLFALSAAGQKLVYDTWGSDLDLLPGSRTRGQIAKIEAEYGIKMKRFDIAWEIKNDAGNKAWSDITKILAKRK
jgi:iron(III) transport system substrate-binding protein